MIIKEKRKEANLTQKQFAELFGIPIDVIKSWDSGRRNPPEWVENLLIKELNKEIMHMEKMKKNEIWLEEKGFEDYAKGLFFLGALMKEAEGLKDFKWEYQKDPCKSGLDRHDILLCYNTAIEIIRESKDMAWNRAEKYLAKIAQYLPDIPGDKHLEDRGKNGTDKMLSAMYCVNAGRTLS